MKPWFRHYVGMTRDDKLIGVAGRTRQPLDRVLFVWISILESASELERGGAFAVEAESIAYTIRCEPADVTAILAALEVSERTRDGVVTRWKDRQFESDSSRDRMRRHRNRENGGGNGEKPHSDDTKPDGDGDVTSQNRTVTRPEHRTQNTDKIPSPDGDGRPAAAPVDPEILDPLPIDPQARLFESGKVLLGKNAGGQIAKLLRAHRNDVAAAQERIDRAARAQDPAEFIAGCIRTATGPPPRVSAHRQAMTNIREELDRARAH